MRKRVNKSVILLEAGLNYYHYTAVDTPHDTDYFLCHAVRSAGRVLTAWSTAADIADDIMAIINAFCSEDEAYSLTLHRVLMERGLLPTCELDSAEYAAMARTFFFCLLWRVRNKEVKDEQNAQRATHDCGCNI